MSASAREWAIITPTYHFDYQQFKLMCESMDHFVEGNWHHYVVVSQSDFEMFAGFTGPHRTVIESKKILPSWLRYIGKLGRIRSGNFWFSWRTGPVFGWHLQQLVKISMANYVKQDALLLVDSDVFFMRRFNLDAMVKNNRLPFVRRGIDHNLRKTPPYGFVDHSKKTLGLPKNNPSFDYVNNIVVWDRKTVLELCAFIEKRHKKHWIAALSGLHTISEGMLYGLYVDFILEEKQRFVVETYDLAKTVQSEKAFYGAELENFIKDIDDHVVALGFQSSAQFDNDTLRGIYNRFASAKKTSHHVFG